MLERGRPVLARDDGGRWRLERSAKFCHLLGRRVTITGVRVDFDVLDVDTIVPLGTGARAPKRAAPDDSIVPENGQVAGRLARHVVDALKRLI